MTRSLFKYVWIHSKRDQLTIFAVVIASLPFYYASLDLPRRIVNEAIQGRAFEKGRDTAPFLELSLGLPDLFGGHRWELFPGFQVGRLELLFGLSLVFLFFVLINGWFKYWINVEKGALGERMMRRMRFELFSSALRFNPTALRTVKSSEAATIIKDEVEPIGGFIGDALIQPVLLGTQAATALIFILLQSMWLGLIAAGIVGVQFVVIPRMRRELIRLGRQRQLKSRQLAGRIGEVIDGLEAVDVHDTVRWERAEVGQRLFELFDIRFKIYKRKFVVKYLNNLLAQLTPFFFYAVGGYFALKGRLDIGQLVAVISAYRELPPPLKELIDWDQQRLDAQVKYEQIVAYFAPERLLPEQDPDERDADDGPLEGPLVVEKLTVLDPHGNVQLSDVNLELSLPARIGLLSEGGPSASLFARVIARRERDYSGRVTIAGRDLAQLSHEIVGRRITYAGIEPYLFPTSLRENLAYGLRTRPLPDATSKPNDIEDARRLAEARWTGNPVDSVATSWLDLGRAGVASAEELDDKLLAALKRMGLGGEIYRFGLTENIDPERDPALAERIVEARERLRQKLQDGDMVDLIEPFDPDRYNTQATIAENLLFGVPTRKSLIGRASAEDNGFRAALDAAGLTEDLIGMGAHIAETMADIFAGVPAGHPLFEQFSFIGADELEDYLAVAKRYNARGMRRGGPTREDRTRLLALPLAYVEPRHRLGLLDDAVQGRLLDGRKLVRERFGKLAEPGIEFYDPAKVNMAAPVRDNLLFGRVNETIADARDHIRAEGAAVIDEMGLRAAIERVGLSHQVGPAGRLLTAAQRAAVSLIRCYVEGPDILVIDGALAPFGERRAEEVLGTLMDMMEGATIAVVLPNDQASGHFDTLVRFEGTDATVSEPGQRHPGGVTAEAAE